jgi:hypothetical protein
MIAVLNLHVHKSRLEENSTGRHEMPLLRSVSGG